ncbi:MAG: hypothetical protein ACK419_03375, partial [Pyrinomonadaceae bacterium]
MSETRKPDDDFLETKPFIDAPKREDQSDYRSDWEKTNYLSSEVSSPSDWEKTTPSINIEKQSERREKNFPEHGWEDKTRADIYLGNIAQNQPERNVPSTKQKVNFTEQIATSQESSKFSALQSSNAEKVTRIPAWTLYASIGIMFLLLASTMIISYLLFSKKYGFDVILIGAHPNSDVFVNGVRWGISSFDGSIRLIGLRAGEHRIEVKNPNYLYDVETVRGNDGEQMKVTLKYRAKTTPTPAPIADECNEIKKGEFEKAAR